MRVLFDTNIWVAAFLTRGACHELVEHGISSHTLLISEEIFKELDQAFRHLDFPKEKIEVIASFIRRNTVMTEVRSLSQPVCRDPDDDKILASALGGNARCIVTGDDDLLSMKEFQGIPILKPAEFWKFEKS